MDSKQKPPEESGGAAHVRAEIGPQEKNETTPKRHGSKLEGNYSSVNFTACSYVSRSSASGDRRTAKCSEAIIADISMSDLQYCAAGLKAGSDPAGWLKVQTAFSGRRRVVNVIFRAGGEDGPRTIFSYLK